MAKTKAVQSVNRQENRTVVCEIPYRILHMLGDNEHRTGVCKVPYGMLKCWDANQTVRVRVEYRTYVTVKGKGGGPPFKGVCCKEWAVTINLVTTLENSTSVCPRLRMLLE